MNQSLLPVIHHIDEDILSLAHLIMDENGLKNSSLKEDVSYTVEISPNPVIKILFNDYIAYIENGRKPNSSETPPISDLRDWAQRKGLPTNNSTLFAIAQMIRINGMSPRPILATLEKEIEKSFEKKWADDLFEVIIANLEKFFNTKS